MKKIFIDANIVIDYLDKSSAGHSDAVSCIRIIRKHFGKPFVSPITFVITNFILEKFAKNKQWHKRQTEVLFSGFEITDLRPAFIRNIFKGHFSDLEDALQYECALSAKTSAIITKDIQGFFASKIPVIHPQDFVRRYNML